MLLLHKFRCGQWIKISHDFPSHKLLTSQTWSFRFPSKKIIFVSLLWGDSVNCKVQHITFLLVGDCTGLFFQLVGYVGDCSGLCVYEPLQFFFFVEYLVGDFIIKFLITILLVDFVCTQDNLLFF